jgi:hypothetical protein
MTDFLGYGKEKRREGNLDILAGRAIFKYVRVERCVVQLTFVQRRLSGDVRERQQEWTHVRGVQESAQR